MDSYQQYLWNIASDPYAAELPQLPDEDFLSMIQKQFPDNDTLAFSPDTITAFPDSANLQSIRIPPLTPNSLSPPSDESESSPPGKHQDLSAKSATLSISMPDMNDHDSVLKRKANDEADPNSNTKSQHLSSSPSKKGPTRKKSEGIPPQDVSRLLKRKEQNRAAQRAFRERKERHVKDLEDQVAELQAQNDKAMSENENLRDLLVRLQSQMPMSRQQSQFTFALPSQSTSKLVNDKIPPQPHVSASPERSSSMSSTSSSLVGALTTPSPTLPGPPFDWSSLHVLDPNLLDAMDETPQPTATGGAMQMDFGFGDGLNFTTIASNPQYMSFADAYETLPGVHFKDSFTNDGTNDNNADDGTFDFGIMPEWPPLSPAAVPGSLEELFGIGHSNAPNLQDFSNAFPSSSSQSSLSPVSHANKVPSLTSGSSPASNPSVWNTPRESPAAIPEEANQHPQQRLQQQHDESKCPKTKESLSRHIKELGASPFVEIPPQVSSLQKVFDPKLGMVVGCAGAPQFPRTQQSDKNVEVIAAWKRITADPNFKEADINELCSQFSSKARCDGEKLVLEPQGVSQILETFTNKKKNHGP